MLSISRTVPPLIRAGYHSPVLVASLATLQHRACFSSLGTQTRHSPVSTSPRLEKEGSGPDIQHSFQPHPFDDPSKLMPVPKGVSTHAPAPHSRPYEDWVLFHPVYETSELEAVKVTRKERRTFGDKFASFLVAVSRKGFDVVTGYKHGSPEAAREALRKKGLENASLEVLRKEGFLMDVPMWMSRILFLETIAGIPGMVAGILRHLQSLRLMKRDGGWIKTLLEESENERMHLMTFLKIKDPSPFFRFIVLGAQGVYFNLFFLLYIISPRSAHAFVGYLEEEAVVTYTQIADEIKRGNLPEWDSSPTAQKVPNIAKDYWRLDDSATMIDLIMAVRADEAGHRFVNQTLSELKSDDFNPFAVKHASTTVQGTVPGFTREQSLAWTKQVEDEFKAAKAAAAAEMKSSKA